MLFLPLLFTVILSHLTHTFKNRIIVEDSKEQTDGLDLRNILKDIYNLQKHNILRLKDPIRNRNNIKIFKIIKTSDDDETPISRRYDTDEEADDDIYNVPDEPVSVVDTSDNKEQTKDRGFVEVNKDTVKLNLPNATIEFIFKNVSSNVDINVLEINTNENVSVPVKKRNTLKNVPPNNIFLKNEKKCANWMEDCNIMGVKDKLFKVLWSRYNS